SNAPKTIATPLTTTGGALVPGECNALLRAPGGRRQRNLLCRLEREPAGWLRCAPSRVSMSGVLASARPPIAPARRAPRPRHAGAVFLQLSYLSRSLT